MHSACLPLRCTSPFHSRSLAMFNESFAKLAEATDTPSDYVKVRCGCAFERRKG